MGKNRVGLSLKIKTLTEARMKLYGGIDLHSTNSYIVLIDEQEKVVLKQRFPNELQMIIYELNRYPEIDSLVVESTYNWYWLVDGLQEAGFKIKLANPNAIQQYNGLKHTNDKTDALWLAKLNLLNLLPQGYIYPKETRPIRDMLRKRMWLVQMRTSHILSLQTIVERNTAIRLTGNEITQKLNADTLSQYLKNDEIFMAANSDLMMITNLNEQIKIIEKYVLKNCKENPVFALLNTVPGIGKILGLTILLETGEISRFEQVGNYASYCRCVNSERVSNGKKKGENNRKNGNKYLGWAYIEAANYAIRYNETIKKYYQRKNAKKLRVVALKAIAHKIARACYFIMRDRVEFDEKLSFT